ncbi:hypothetical protein [Streptomyces sp. NPDC096033]|uniref:hypothetical protein n=1 Tax=Streptomyces sp. NPDC096033 TaxID=3366071 RepID=UPI0038196C5F
MDFAAAAFNGAGLGSTSGRLGFVPVAFDCSGPGLAAGCVGFAAAAFDGAALAAGRGAGEGGRRTAFFPGLERKNQMTITTSAIYTSEFKAPPPRLNFAHAMGI